MTTGSRRLRDVRRYALIGLFVVGAAVVASIGLATFFGGGFGDERTRALMVFRGSVSGLDVGTEVQFRGMRIGEVREVRTLYDPPSGQVQFAVIAEFSGKIEIAGADRDQAVGAGVWLQDVIDRGLRAQLQTRSFVTGQQVIMLDFAPADDPPQFSRLGIASFEIPTRRSSSEQIADTLREVPVRELAADAQRLIAGVDRLLNDQPGRPAPLPTLLDTLTTLAADLDRSAPRMADEIGSTAREARTALTTLAQAARTVERQVDAGGTAVAATAQDVQRLSARLDTVVAATERTIAAAERAFARVEQAAVRADQTVARLDHALSDDSSIGAGLASTLSEATAAARSLRGAAESLQRDPQSLLLGRPARSER